MGGNILYSEAHASGLHHGYKLADYVGTLPPALGLITSYTKGRGAATILTPTLPRRDAPPVLEP